MELEQASLLVLTTKLKRNGWLCDWVGRWVGEHFVSPLWSVNLGPIPRRASSLVGSGDLGSLLSRAAPLPPPLPLNHDDALSTPHWLCCAFCLIDLLLGSDVCGGTAQSCGLKSVCDLHILSRHYLYGPTILHALHYGTIIERFNMRCYMMIHQLF